MDKMPKIDFKGFQQEVNDLDPLIKVVRLKEGKEIGITYDIRLRIPKQTYLNKTHYEEGNGVYLSERFYKKINATCLKYFGVVPTWNNTKHTFWFIK